MAYAGHIAALATALAWTIATFLWSSVGTKLTPPSMNLLRMPMAAAVLTATLWATSGSPWPDAMGDGALAMLAASGVLGLAIGDAFYYAAMLRIGPRRALTMWLASPVITALLGIPLLGEHIGAPGWIGIGVTLLGVGVVQFERTGGAEWEGRPLTRRVLTLAALAVLMAAACHALASVMTKQVLNEGMGPLAATQVRASAAAVATLLAAVVLGRLKRWAAPYGEARTLRRGTAAVLIGSCLGLGLMTYSQGAIPLGLSNTLSSTAPLFAVPVAAVALGERARPWTVIWTLVAFGGVALIFLE